MMRNLFFIAHWATTRIAQKSCHYYLQFRVCHRNGPSSDVSGLWWFIFFLPIYQRNANDSSPLHILNSKMNVYSSWHDRRITFSSIVIEFLYSKCSSSRPMAVWLAAQSDLIVLLRLVCCLQNWKNCKRIVISMHAHSHSFARTNPIKIQKKIKACEWMAIAKKSGQHPGWNINSSK